MELSPRGLHLSTSGGLRHLTISTQRAEKDCKEERARILALHNASLANYKPRLHDWFFSVVKGLGCPVPDKASVAVLWTRWYPSGHSL
jgi:hypothetical protein